MYNPQIYTFVCVADYGSFSKAAEKLFLSTVSVMKQINSLENRLGTTLVERSSQGIRLTNAGKYVYDQSKQIINLSDTTLQHLAVLEEMTKPTIRLATSLLHPDRHLTRILAENLDELPFQLNLVPFSDEKRGLRNVIESLGKDIDCIVSLNASPSWDNICSFFPMGEMPCCCAVPRNHHLAKKDVLTWDDLNGEKLMLMEKGASAVIDKIREDIASGHKDITIVDIPYLYDFTTFNTCIKNGCLLEITELWKDVHPGLKLIPVKWDYSLSYGIVYAKDPSPDVQDFINLINSILNNPQ